MEKNNIVILREFPDIKKEKNSIKTKGRPPGSNTNPKPGMI